MADPIGKKIKQLRKQLDMTQEELGQKVGVTKATINKYETGIVVNLRRPTIEKLAKALEVSPAYLMGWIETTPNQGDNLIIHTFPGGTVNCNTNNMAYNDNEKAVSNEEVYELLHIFKRLDFRKRVELLMYAIKLEESTKE